MEYTKVKLGDILTSISETISKEQQTAIFLNTSDISEGKFLHKRSSVVKELPGQAKKKIKNGDILFSEIRPKNKRYAVVDVSNPNDYVVSTKLMVLRIKDPSKYYLQYIYQQLISQKMLHQINEIAESRSGTFPQITFDAIKNIELTPPPLEEQKRIADIFTVLDDKIELNNQMNQTLEEIASLLYKRWFVDFEFPDDKCNPYKSSGGEMVDSELGMIPKGWEVKKLGDICETIASGSTPSKIDVDNALDTSNELIGFIKVKDIINSEIQFSKIEFIPLLISEEKMRRSILKENDILLSMAGTIGRTARVSKEFSNMNINQALATIRVEDIIMIPYVYCWINSIATQDSFKSKTVHAVQANLSLSSIRKQKILIPETKVIKSYYNKINYNFKKIDLNILEINKLKKIKINYLKILL